MKTLLEHRYRVRPVNKMIPRKAILKEIRSHLDAIEQWSEMQSWGNAAKYAAKAEALIELVETDDCGSTGGFDDRRGQERSYSLEDRYQWLRSLESTR